MSYLTVITLVDAKQYLRIDDTLTDDDAQITRMINASLSFVENWTQHYVFARDITHKMVEGHVRVYDTPINSVIPPNPDLVIEVKTLHTNYTLGTETSDLVLNTGYVLPVDVPGELVEVAYEIIDILYYGSKQNGTLEEQMSMLSMEILNRYKRFVL